MPRSFPDPIRGPRSARPPSSYALLHPRPSFACLLAAGNGGVAPLMFLVLGQFLGVILLRGYLFAFSASRRPSRASIRPPHSPAFSRVVGVNVCVFSVLVRGAPDRQGVPETLTLASPIFYFNAAGPFPSLEHKAAGPPFTLPTPFRPAIGLFIFFASFLVFLSLFFALRYFVRVCLLISVLGFVFFVFCRCLVRMVVLGLLGRRSSSRIRFF